MTVLPIIEILLANIIWGFGFVATAWALTSYSSNQILLYRFLLAGLVGLILYLLVSRKNLKKYILVSFVPSLFLIMEIYFQIFSLQFTSATEGGFLFVTYIIMIPVIEYILFKKYLTKMHMIWIAMGILGSILMIKSGEVNFNKGEMTMLISAFFASAHVVSIDRADRTLLNSFFLNTFQLLWGILLTCPLYYFIDAVPEISFSDKAFGDYYRWPLAQPC